jgi:hypothetical protein
MAGHVAYMGSEEMQTKFLSENLKRKPLER